MERRPFASLTVVATAAKLLLAVVVLADVAAAVSSFRLLQLSQDAMQLGQWVIYAELELVEQTHASVRTFQLGVYAIAGLVLALWFVRAHANVRAVNSERRPAPVLASPSRLAGELWRGSDPGATGKVPGLYGAWWRTFVAGAILVVAGTWFWSTWVYGEAVVQLEVAAVAQVVGNLLGVASAVLTYVVVDRTSKRQHAKLRFWTPVPAP